MATENSHKRAAAFYFLLGVPILAWAALVLPNAATVYLPNQFPNAFNMSSAALSAAVSAFGFVSGDISVFGELTPIALSGAIIALLPDSHGKLNGRAIALAVIVYLMFLHLSIYFSTGAGVSLLSFIDGDINESKKTILALISKIRIMAIVIAAAIIGINVKGTAQMGE